MKIPQPIAEQPHSQGGSGAADPARQSAPAEPKPPKAKPSAEAPASPPPALSDSLSPDLYEFVAEEVYDRPKPTIPSRPRCASCGAVLPSDSDFCITCGQDTPYAAPATDSRSAPARKKRRRRSSSSGGDSLVNAGVLGGFLIMGAAAVWFIGGLFVGILFYYPPILFIIGLVAVIRGLFSGD